MRRSLPPLLLLLVCLVAPRPLTAQVRQPEPYQRLVASVRLRSLLAGPTRLPSGSRAPIPVAMRLAPRPGLVAGSLHLDLLPGVDVHFDSSWFPFGTRTTIGLTLRLF